jgi:hypothetical protein
LFGSQSVATLIASGALHTASEKGARCQLGVNALQEWAERQSGGGPRKPKPRVPSPFAILDELLMVHEPNSVGELPLEDAMLIKTYQRAITGGLRAGKKIVKRVLEREKLRFKSHALRPPRITSKLEQDPENALDALEILGIAQGRRMRA